jgi:PBP1b-binding outer membrane lipoprotein LpoB
MNKNFYKRTSIKTLLAVIFSIVFLIGCYSKENFIAKSPTPAQNENVSNITNKDIQDFLSSIRKVDGNLDPQSKKRQAQNCNTAAKRGYSKRPPLCSSIQCDGYLI